MKFTGSSPPQNFTVEVLNTTAVEISWSYPDSPNGEIQGYTILYAEFPDDIEVLINITLDTIDDTSDQSYVIFDLLPFTQYSFRVRAFSFDDDNETLSSSHIGIASDEMIVRTDEDGKTLYFNYCNNIIYIFLVPAAPTNFTVVTVNSTVVQLSWNMPDVTNGILTNYTLIYTGNDDTSTIIFNFDTFSATITGLDEDSFYLFIIYANSSAGAGPNSTISVVTLEDRK